MCALLPIDVESRSVCSRARAIVHYKFNSEHWEYRESTGIDVGIDCMLELTENDQWTGNVIECQVKGRTKPDYNKTKEFVSIQVKTSTVNYWINKKNPVLLLVVDISTEEIFYLDVKAYFADFKGRKRLDTSQSNLTLRVPVENVVTNDDDELIQIAKSKY